MRQRPAKQPASRRVTPRRITLANSFGAALRDFPLDQQNSIKEAVKKFRDRTAEHALRVERKEGIGCWAFRVPAISGVRVFFVQERDDEGRKSRLFHVGPHDDYRIVKRKIPR